MKVRVNSPSLPTESSATDSVESGLADVAHGISNAFPNPDSPLQPRKRRVTTQADSTAKLPRTATMGRGTPTPQGAAAEASIDDFASSVGNGDKTLVVVGGGTAAITYLATAEIDKEYTHVAIVGDQGYWGKQAHRLAQPHHILALPEQPSARFVDPSEHDASGNILPHDDRSAYVHSTDYQKCLQSFGKRTVDRLRDEGRKVVVASDVSVDTIARDGDGYRLKTSLERQSLRAHKVVVATGPSPARKLEAKRLPKGSPSTPPPQVLTYNDILTPTIADRINGKDILIYGGGPTSAWAMEVAQLHAKSATWVARNGFEVAKAAGPRVKAIIEATRSAQLHGEIESVAYLDLEKATEERQLRVNVSLRAPNGAKSIRSLDVDFIVNSIGQDAMGAGGLHDVLSPDIRRELQPIPDRNGVTGIPDAMLGFGTPSGDLQIIGAAAASYQDKENGLYAGRLASETLPRSGQVGITIGGVVASVAALTDHMPFRQEPSTGEFRVTGLNMHVMNATQLAVYFTATFPDAPASLINGAVQDFLNQRSKTEFGLSDRQVKEFLQARFGDALARVTEA
jgi:hypothetical protein